MKLTKAQAIIASDTHRFRVVCSGRRFGKTFLSVEEIKGKALAKPTRIAYCATTYRQARDIAWEILKKELQPIIIDANESRLEIKTRTLQKGQSLIVLRGWESIETLRGQQFDFMVIDEVAMMRNFQSMWQEVIRPTLTDTQGEVLFCSTPKGFNHFYDLYNQERIDKDFKSFHFTSYDNPHLPKEEIDKAKQELTEDRFAQEYLADFRKTEGLVYKEFDREKHLYSDETKISFYEKIGGVDFGYTNPSAVMTIIKDIKNNYWIDNEWYFSHKTDAEIADYVALQEFHRVYADPEAPAAIEELKRKKVNVREVQKGKDSVKNGIQVIRELFKANRLKISYKCVNLIYELEVYSYPEKKDMRSEEELPIKENDHACLIGDTKILLRDGKSKKIKNIKIGDKVRTQNGIQKVINCGLTKKQANIYEIELSNGYKLRGTGNHKVFTDKGNISIDTLRYGDIINVLWENKLYLMVKNLIGTAGIIHQLVGIKMDEKDYIKKFGYSIMEKYPKDFISITKMGTEKIIKLTILNLLKLRNIYQTIIKKIGKNKNLEKRLEGILKILEYLQQNGINQKKVKNGILNTRKKFGLTEKQLLKNVKYVQRNLKHIVPQSQDFAIKIVKRKHCGKEDVYNLTIEKEHNYYANKILVKNCDAIRYALATAETKQNYGEVKFYRPNWVAYGVKK